MKEGMKERNERNLRKRRHRIRKRKKGEGMKEIYTKGEAVQEKEKGRRNERNLKACIVYEQ